MKTAIIILGLLLAGCATVPDGKCSGYERGRLSGLKIGSAINPAGPDVSGEIAAIEAECAG